MSDMCPGLCANSGSATAEHGIVGGLVGDQPDVMCRLLLELDESCAYDVTTIDPAAPPGTLVSDICVQECAGRAACVPPALELPFIASGRDVDARAGRMTIAGSACVDSGGVRFDGDGGVSVTPPDDLHYGATGEFSVSFWLNKDPSPARIIPLYDEARGGDTGIHPKGG